MSTPAVFQSSVGPAAVTSDLLTTVGWADPDTRSATTVLMDHGHSTIESRDEGIVVMPIAEALLSYPWVQDLMFSLIDPDADETLRRAFESAAEPVGTFTWVRDGAQVSLPQQSFTVMTKPQERQYVHDITVIGKGAKVDMVSGSAVPTGLKHGTHVSVNETFIGEGAQVRCVDVDRWGPEMTTRSYNRTRIGEGASVSSVSVAVSKLRDAWTNDITEVAADASYIDHSILFAPEGTNRHMETEVILTGEGAQVEQVARMVADGGLIHNANTLTATVPGVRGFLECDGLMLRDAEAGAIESIPALNARVAGAQLSHEASIGMIDQEKLDYLKATGLDEDSARDLIVQGFLNLEEAHIPAAVRERVDSLVSAARGAEQM